MGYKKIYREGPRKKKKKIFGISYLIKIVLEQSLFNIL